MHRVWGFYPYHPLYTALHYVTTLRLIFQNRKSLTLVNFLSIFYYFGCHRAFVILSICMAYYTGIKEFILIHPLNTCSLWSWGSGVLKHRGKICDSLQLYINIWRFYTEQLNLLSLGSLCLALFGTWSKNHVFFHSVVHPFISKPRNTCNSNLYVISR